MSLAEREHPVGFKKCCLILMVALQREKRANDCSKYWNLEPHPNYHWLARHTVIAEMGGRYGT